MPRGPRNHDENRPHFVYRCYDADGALLYVGCTVNPTVRVEQHRATAWWGQQIATVRNLVFPNRQEALKRERGAIYTERPACNVKNRWYTHDPREEWRESDYRNFELALERTDLVGLRTQMLLRRVVAERADRFAVMEESA